MVKNRNINLEILRIIAVFMVMIGHHMGAGHGTVYFICTEKLNSFNYCVWQCLFAFIVPISIFYMISGYFLVGNKFKIGRAYSLWRTVFFYSVVLFLFSCFLRYFLATSYGGYVLSALGVPDYEIAYRLETWGNDFGNIGNIKEWFNVLLPIVRSRYGFISTYMVMYLLSPALNKMIYGLTKKQYQYTLAVSFIFFTFLPCVFATDFASAYSTTGIVWAVFMYFVAGYLRLHFDIKRYRPRTYAIASLTLALTRVVLRMGFDNLSVMLGKENRWDSYLSGAEFTVPTLLAITMFCFMASLELKSHKLDRFWVGLSSVTFGIYLLHDNLNTRLFMWDVTKADRTFGSALMWPTFFFDVFILFFLFVGIDFLRQLLFKKWDKLVAGTVIIKKRNALFCKIDSFVAGES